MGSTGRLFAGAAVAGALVMLAPAPAAHAAEDVTVIVQRQGEEAVTGRLTTYRITVDNPGAEPAAVNVRATLPRRMEDVTATGGARTPEGVQWRLTVPAQGVATVVVAGVYGSGAETGRTPPRRVAVTACVLVEEDRLAACDTDIAELAPPGWFAQWWWVAIPLGVAAAWYLRRRRRPQKSPAALDDIVVDLGVVERPAGTPATRRTWLPRLAVRSRPR